MSTFEFYYGLGWLISFLVSFVIISIYQEDEEERMFQIGAAAPATLFWLPIVVCTVVYYFFFITSNLIRVLSNKVRGDRHDNPSV